MLSPRLTVPPRRLAPESATPSQSVPSTAVTACGRPPTLRRSATTGPLRVDAHQRPGELVRHPDRAGRRRDARGAVVAADRDRGGHDAALAVDPRHRPLERVGDPDGVVADRQGRDATAHLHRLGRRGSGRVDRSHRPGRRAAGPHDPVAARQLAGLAVQRHLFRAAPADGVQADHGILERSGDPDRAALGAEPVDLASDRDPPRDLVRARRDHATPCRRGCRRPTPRAVPPRSPTARARPGWSGEWCVSRGRRGRRGCGRDR